MGTPRQVPVSPDGLWSPGSATPSDGRDLGAPPPARRAPRRLIKSPKAQGAQDCQTLEQLPNVGPAMAGDLRALGLHHPGQLAGQDAYALFRALERHSGRRQDPCVLDTFLAVVDFMNGAPARPWWSYTAQRKRDFGELHPPEDPPRV